jgi:threonylcarbamoyladenosine tRNA methylthiotransferase MtaB
VTEVVADKQQLPDLLARRGLVDVPDGISHFGPRRRAYVKVQDGCRMQCSYCIIPTVRPRLVSRPARQVLEEVRRLVDYGHREIVLTGIHLGHYGVDLAENTEGGRRTDLADLLDRIVRIEGDFRVRLSSLEALEVTPKLIRLMAERSDRICPHLHLAMQSGSDAVLARMNRRQGSRPFVERCRAIAESLPQPALTADVIVGFPGETDADFQATCRVVESVGFSKTHVFRFSPRQGTPAAEMADQVPAAVKHDRAAELAELGRALRERFLRHLVGRNLQVLIESSMSDHPGRMVGTSARYAPVELAGSERDIGRLVEATAVRVVNGRVVAENASEA